MQNITYASRIDISVLKWHHPDHELQFPFRELFRTQSNFYEGAFFAKIFNDQKPLTVFSKSFMVDVRLGSKYAFAIYSKCMQNS